MKNQKVNECIVCGHTEDSDIDIIAHVMEDHSLRERLSALFERTQKPEVAE